MYPVRFAGMFSFNAKETVPDLFCYVSLFEGGSVYIITQEKQCQQLQRDLDKAKADLKSKGSRKQRDSPSLSNKAGKRAEKKYQDLQVKYDCDLGAANAKIELLKEQLREYRRQPAPAPPSSQPTAQFSPLDMVQALKPNYDGLAKLVGASSPATAVPQQLQQPSEQRFSFDEIQKFMNLAKGMQLT